MVDCGQGGSNGQGQNQQGAAIEVLPASSFDPGPNGGADLPEPTFLTVVKDCGAQGRGMLSFPKPGISFAMDFPVGDRTRWSRDPLSGEYRL